MRPTLTVQSDAAFSPRTIIAWLRSANNAPREIEYGTPVFAVRDVPAELSADTGLFVQILVPHPFDRRQTVWVTARQSSLVPHLGDTTAIWSPAPHQMVM